MWSFISQGNQIKLPAMYCSRITQMSEQSTPMYRYKTMLLVQYLEFQFHALRMKVYFAGFQFNCHGICTMRCQTYVMTKDFMTVLPSSYYYIICVNGFKYYLYA